MRALDAMPEVEKTSLFGTAVHAVLRSAARRRRRRSPRALAGAGRRGRQRSSAVAPSLEDVFLDVVERPSARRDGGMTQGAGGRPEGAAADRARSADADDPALRPGVLPAALRLRAQLRHPPRRAGGRGSRRHAARAARSSRRSSTPATSTSSATVYAPAEVERLLDRERTRAPCSSFPKGFGRDVGRGAPPPVQVLINGDNANTATTVMGYASSIVRDRGGAARARAACSSRRRCTVEPRIWYNPELRSTLFLVPGPDRLHRDDHRRRLDGAVDRPREGERARWSRCGWRRSTRSRSSSARPSRIS